MESFYFIKYNDTTDYRHIERYAGTTSVLCFDLEDSIEGAENKQRFRQYFIRILDEIIPLFPGVRPGLRINGSVPELLHDIEAIRNRKIHCIIVPKVESPAGLENIVHLLSSANVSFDEIVPLIESRTGLENLGNIVAEIPPCVRKIGFGHCDYNESIGAFPFFQQQSREYWKWMERIYQVIHPKNLMPVNSAFLQLDNHRFFQAMLHHLCNSFGNHCGQFTLTTAQADMVLAFVPSAHHVSLEKMIDHRLDLSVREPMIQSVISGYESNRNGKSFAVVPGERCLISPQEYAMALACRKNLLTRKINVTFVGGCLPVQYDILFEDLFHQRLRRRLATESGVGLNATIIRYEQLHRCLDKIRKHHATNPVDFLVFHVRPEPFLRLVKIWYKYLDHKGKRRYSLNLPVIKLLMPERYDFLVLGRRYHSQAGDNPSHLHQSLVDVNYRIGDIAGNKKAAIQLYLDLVMDIYAFCEKAGIRFVVLGPASRSATREEPVLCEALHRVIQNRVVVAGIPYVACMDRLSEENMPCFQANGIHATAAFHEMIARRLFDTFNEPDAKSNGIQL